MIVFVYFYTFSLDPTRLLLTFGASTNIADRLHGNTALHWAIQAKNHVAFGVLINHGASVDIANNMVMFVRIIFEISVCKNF